MSEEKDIRSKKEIAAEVKKLEAETQKTLEEARRARVEADVAEIS